jgi:hypothetical protein
LPSAEACRVCEIIRRHATRNTVWRTAESICERGMACDLGKMGWYKEVMWLRRKGHGGEASWMELVLIWSLS